jgi:hypothetical protein
MALTYALGFARASSAGNPITTSYTVAKGDSVLVLMLNVGGATDRAGGAPTLGGQTFTQASTTQKAATTPECGAECWYLLKPLVGTWTLTIPNTGALTIKYTVGIGRATAGGRAALGAAVGNNATATNPTPGNLTITEANTIAFAVVATGAQTWAPTPQAGTIIANTDDGATGGGEQYILNAALGTLALGWTFGTSEDYGAVAVWFRDIPPTAIAARLGIGFSVDAAFKGATP